MEQNILLFYNFINKGSAWRHLEVNLGRINKYNQTDDLYEDFSKNSQVDK